MSKSIYDIELPEKAKEEMQELLNAFKDEAVKKLTDSLRDVYTDIGLYIETDSWINYRHELQRAMESDQEWLRESHFGKKFRATILREHKDTLISLINSDLLREVKELKEQIERMHRNRMSY